MLFLKYLLFSRLPQTQSILVQRWPSSAIFRKDPVASRERCSWLGDCGGEERGYGGVLRLHQQRGWFCLLLCPTNCSEYVCKCLNGCPCKKSLFYISFRLKSAVKIFKDEVTSIFCNRSRGDYATR